MPWSHILFEAADDGIALITLHRPATLNAISGGLLEELDQILDRVASDPAIRGLILTGSGEKAFAAGADIAELADLTAIELRDFALRGQRILGKLERLGKPSVAAINGFALGGGLELALACTVRFASEDARLGLPEVKLGLIPGYGGTQRLPRLVGRGRALEMILSGEPVTADEAFRTGLVNAVLPRAELMNHSRAWLARVLKNAPAAVALAMETVDAARDAGFDAALRAEAVAFGLCGSTSDSREGRAAFLEKRAAVFTGK
jgi:enoyl-CoA hydratase